MRVLSLIFGVFFALAQPAASQSPEQNSQPQPAFEQKLREVRFDLYIQGGKFSGSAAPLLQEAISNAQFVLIGEDHLTREIPQFTSIVCDLMVPQGLTAMAVETGPQAAAFVSSLFGSPDRLAQTAALIHQYPASIAFLDMRQENDLAAHCAEVAHRSRFHLWGLDQEFVGSPGWLLDQILATQPGPAASAALKQLKQEEQQAAARAKETGDPSKLFLFTASDSELNQAAAALQRDGNSLAKRLFRELTESREIYLKNSQGSPDSNTQRARLMKENFVGDLEAAEGGSQGQRVLAKFGDWHLYKGFNPLQQRDLGNYIAELADGQGATSLHICILGAKGTHRLFAGYERPNRLEKFVMDEDPDYRWLKPAINNQLPNAWTLFDLRRLRFQSFKDLDPDMQRLIYGYDLLIIVPELTPADPVE